MNCKFGLLVASIILGVTYSVVSVLFFTIGATDSDSWLRGKECREAPYKRWHYVFPAYTLGCKFGPWMEEDLRE